MPYARRTAAAQRDLEGIAFQIAVRDYRPIVADRIIDELIEQADKLARFSKVSTLGTPAPEVGKAVRLFPHRRWVILFRYEPHGIDVLRIADASQDYLSWRLNKD